ncbi:MAG: heavy metal-associated domain-containing protein [Dehalococcoidia bacterium]
MRRALEGLTGVSQASVDLELGTATVVVRGGVAHGKLVEAAERTAVFSWARSVMARLDRKG